ncbi:MAG: ComF family protein [Pseudomonadota bacterium]|nr:ComF family protein [Pseudomonadota bacterium]MDE3037386.1 ComF family protein [Pseudomonadota bacterium]
MMKTHLLNLIFPPQCLSCNAQVPAHGALCLACWSQIKFITDPYCAACGLPFDFALGVDALCGDCLRDRPPFSRARAVFRYDEASRQLVTKLKYADQTQLAAVYGGWLSKFGRELVGSSDVIVPVPLAYWRFVGRRYNQAALLARALSNHSKLPLLPDGLKRIRATRPQPGLTRRQRRDNVRGAFAVTPRSAAKLKGKSVLLVDDVMTTSATLSECTRALLKAETTSVNVLTLARKM